MSSGNCTFWGTEGRLAPLASMNHCSAQASPLSTRAKRYPANQTDEERLSAGVNYAWRATQGKRACGNGTARTVGAGTASLGSGSGFDNQSKQPIEKDGVA